MEEYCLNCEQALPRTVLGKPIGKKFKSGWFCEKCAIHKVEESRRKEGKKRK